MDNSSKEIPEKKYTKVTLLLSEGAIKNLEKLSKRFGWSIHEAADRLIKGGDIIPYCEDLSEVRPKDAKPISFRKEPNQ